MSKEWVTIQEAATAMGVSESAVRRRMRSNKIKHKKEDGRVFVQVDVVPLSTDVDRELVEVLKKHNEELTEQVKMLLRQQDQAQQLTAMQQKAIDKLTDQNQLLLEIAEKGRAWWKFWQ